MDVFEAMHARRTVHHYTTDPVPDGTIERALDAAIMAPNHRLTWPWRFVRTGRRTRGPLADLAVQLKQKPGVECGPDFVAKVRAKILDPAELIVVSITRNPDPAIAREDYAAAACAIQNFCLALTADGVGSKWSSGKVTQHPETYATLGIDPAREEIIGFVWAGVPSAAPKTPQRPPLTEFVRRLP